MVTRRSFQETADVTGDSVASQYKVVCRNAICPLASPQQGTSSQPLFGCWQSLSQARFNDSDSSQHPLWYLGKKIKEDALIQGLWVDSSSHSVQFHMPEPITLQELGSPGPEPRSSRPVTTQNETPQVPL